MAMTPFRNPSGVEQDGFEQLVRRVMAPGSSGPVTAGAFAPALDVREDSDNFTLYVELPGVAPDDVDITLEDSVLTIAGHRSTYDEVDEAHYRRVERVFGRFHRSVRLPARIQGDGISAHYDAGVLTVTVPKAEEAKPRRVAIEAG